MADKFSYSSFEFARIIEKSPKQSLLPGVQPLETHRAAFMRDHAHVPYSAALRRLADKTQVVGPEESDALRTCLTHSLKVAQISHRIASELGADKDFAELAGLTRDIGHPLYGHNGKRTLSGIAVSCDEFRSNIQALRILTRFEPEVLDGTGEPCGLNLARTAFDAVCKCP